MWPCLTLMAPGVSGRAGGLPACGEEQGSELDLAKASPHPDCASTAVGGECWLQQGAERWEISRGRNDGEEVVVWAKVRRNLLVQSG